MNKSTLQPVFIFLLLIVFASSCTATRDASKRAQNITGVRPSYAQSDTSLFTLKGNDTRLPGLQFFYVDSAITGASHSFTLAENSRIAVFLKTPAFIHQNDLSRNMYYVYPHSELTAIQNKNGYV